MDFHLGLNDGDDKVLTKKGLEPFLQLDSQLDLEVLSLQNRRPLSGIVS